jgi:hypothetical protein
MNNQDIPPWVDDPSIPTDDLAALQPDRPVAKAIRPPTSAEHLYHKRSGEQYVTFQGYIHRQTEKAILFECIMENGVFIGNPGEEGKKEWFPLSQTKSITRPSLPATAAGEYDNITVTQWIARTKGFKV